MDAGMQDTTDGTFWFAVTRSELNRVDEIKRALKAIDLMKILDGQVALGNKSNSKNLGEHKVRIGIRDLFDELTWPVLEHPTCTPTPYSLLFFLGAYRGPN